MDGSLENLYSFSQSPRPNLPVVKQRPRQTMWGHEVTSFILGEGESKIILFILLPN